MNKARIVVVDDEDGLLEIYNQILSKDYDVHAFDRASKALEAIEGGLEFDILISDISMPDMTGIELLTKLRDKGVTKPAIIVTAFANKENAIKSLGLQVFSLLEKPFEPELFLHMVKKAIGLGLMNDLTVKMIINQQILTRKLEDLLTHIKHRLVEIEDELYDVKPVQDISKTEKLKQLKELKETNDLEKLILKIKLDLKALETEKQEVNRFYTN